MTRRETRMYIDGLYRSHRNEVYRAALRKLGDHHEAEDVTQTAFLDAYRAMLRGSHPDMPRAWLLAIAENVRRRRFRTTLRRPREEPLREALPSAEPPWRAQTEEIRTALLTLAESQRKAFLLRELGGFSYGEIAEQLDTSVPAVQMLLFRARQKLRSELDRSVPARVAGLVPIPHWLLGLADRVSTGFAAPRLAGLLATSVLAAGVGVGVVSDVSVAESKRQPAAPVQPALVSAARAPAAAPAAVRTAARPAPVAKRAQRAKQAKRSTVTEISTTRVVQSGRSEPAAPVAPPATLGKGDVAPAPALVPALPPVSQAPIVSVVETHPPPLPELPGTEGIPALPDIPIVQPPVPALPGGAEVTTPEVTGPLAGP
jgi:RNA polymerase sigma-70 factor (ECF subfamily)